MHTTTIKIYVLCMLLQIKYSSSDDNNRPFTYSEQSTKQTYGLDEWDKVSKSQYYFPWDDYYQGSFHKNKCEWKPTTSSRRSNNHKHNQSPINIAQWDDCNERKDDKHRWMFNAGDCTWDSLNWKIQPWGLEMTLPMPNNSNQDPSYHPCIKPNFDSSGGYGGHFFMNYMLVKTPSEHTIMNQRYDGEISFGLFRYEKGEKHGGPPFTTHILLNAERDNVDNPVLQPYLMEWWTRHESTLRKCSNQGNGNNNDVPTDVAIVDHNDEDNVNKDDGKCNTNRQNSQSKAQHALSTLKSYPTGGESTDHEGIMFDLSFDHNNHNNNIIKITSFDINVQDKKKTNIQIFTKQGSWQGHEKRKSSWKNLGTYRVKGRGRNKATHITLQRDSIVELTNDDDNSRQPPQIQAFYIVQVDGRDNIQNVKYKSNQMGESMKSDNIMSIHVGMAIQYKPFSNERKKEYKKGRGFSGSVYYTLEQPTQTQTQKSDCSRTLQRTRLNRNNHKFDHFDPFRLYPSPWFYRYRGSFTMPQCFDNVRVRVVDRPLEISTKQLDRINTMISQMRDSDTCEFSTVGDASGRRGDSGDYVDTNRPLQKRSSKHDLKYCNSGDWGSGSFFTKSPRGNTCWCYLTGECGYCKIDKLGNCQDSNTCDSHWYPQNTKFS